jgi:hypothetical protein
MAFAIFRLPFPEAGKQEQNKTINRQLFFLWLDNVFVFD